MCGCVVGVHVSMLALAVGVCGVCAVCVCAHVHASVCVFVYVCVCFYVYPPTPLPATPTHCFKMPTYINAYKHTTSVHVCTCGNAIHYPYMYVCSAVPIHIRSLATL